MPTSQATDDKRTERALLALILLLGTDLEALCRRMAEEQLTAITGAAAAWGLLYQAHRQAAVLGAARGGMTGLGAVWLIAGVAQAATQAQIAFLRGFAADLQAGRYAPTEEGGSGAGMMAARARLYGNALVGTANEAWRQALLAVKPDVQGYWALGEAEHCRDCEYEERQGWRPLSAFTRLPGQGRTACKVNCKCSLMLNDGRASFVLKET